VIDIINATATREKGKAYKQCIIFLNRSGIIESALDLNNILFIRKDVRLRRKAIMRKKIGRRCHDTYLSGDRSLG
jgi:hypothetical protein